MVTAKRRMREVIGFPLGVRASSIVVNRHARRDRLRAARQSDRLEALIEQLLLLARADEHHLTAHTSEVGVDRLLRDIGDTTPADHLTVILESAGDSKVRGHPDHLERLFRNVLDNAVRHAATTVHIRTTTTDERVVTEIADDGPGNPGRGPRAGHLTGSCRSNATGSRLIMATSRWDNAESARFQKRLHFLGFDFMRAS